MNGVAAIIILALIEYLVLAAMVGRARLQYNVPAPATAGHPIFERYFRVHQNTMEQLIVFIPALILFADYVNVLIAIILGALFIIARAIYAAGYIRDPEKRAAGATVSFIINAVLLIGSLIGIIV